MKKHLLLSFPLLLLSAFTLHAQVIFEKRYGKDSKEYESLRNGVVTPDGGLLLSGFTESGTQGAYDFFLHKLNADGTEAWLKTYGGPNMDLLSDLVPAAGGGYLISGYGVDPDDGSFDAVLAKVDENGAVLWWQTFGTEALEAGLSLCQRNDGSIVLMGQSITPSAAPALFRAVFDANGTFLTSFLTPASDDLADLKAVPTADGGYLAYINGGNIFFGASDGLLKYDAGHNLQWSITPEDIAAQIGLSFISIRDLKPTATGLALAIDASGPGLVHLSNSAPVVTWYKKLANSGVNAGLHVFSDGTIAAVSWWTTLTVKKFSASGQQQDSVAMAWTAPGGFKGHSVFHDAQNFYLFDNYQGLGSNDYVAVRADLSVPAVAWQQTLGESGETNDADTGNAIAALPDGGFIMAGTRTGTSGPGKVWLLRADAQGSVLWEKTYTLSTSSFHEPVIGSVAVDAGGNIVLLAVTDNYEPEYRLLRFTSAGDSLWDRLVGTSDYAPDFFRAIALSGGGFLAGITFDYDAPTSQPKLIRLDNNGMVDWTKTYDGRLIHDVTEMPDGSIVAAGNKEVSNDGQPWIFKADPNGNVLWEKTYPAGDYGVLNTVRSGSGGHLFAGGASVSDANNEIKAQVLRVDADGNVVWQSEFTKGDGSFWQAVTVLPEADGGCCFLGQFLAPPASPDFITSVFRYRVSMTGLDGSGKMVNDQVFGTDGSLVIGSDAGHTTDGKAIFCATLYTGTALQDAWVVKTDCSAGVATTEAEMPGTLSVSPNPATVQSGVLFASEYRGALQLRLFDARGVEVLHRIDEKTDETWSTLLPVQALPAGMYWLEIGDGKRRTVKALTVER